MSWEQAQEEDIDRDDDLLDGSDWTGGGYYLYSLVKQKRQPPGTVDSKIMNRKWRQEVLRRLGIKVRNHFQHDQRGSSSSSSLIYRNNNQQFNLVHINWWWLVMA